MFCFNSKKMQQEYEELINEAKLIVEESEARHHKLVEDADAQKRANVSFFGFLTFVGLSSLKIQCQFISSRMLFWLK
jgi:hypothetical protein